MSKEFEESTNEYNEWRGSPETMEAFLAYKGVVKAYCTFEGPTLAQLERLRRAGEAYRRRYPQD